MDELQTILQPQRMQGESYEDYKARRTAANKAVKQALKGRLIWDSAVRGQWFGVPQESLSKAF
jgi:hypothetical protein